MMFKKRFLLILCMLVLPVTLMGQSTLYFPRAFTPADLATIGFAVVNPSAADATVNFRLLSASGSAISLATRTIRRQGQVAQLGSELFPSATTAGWVEATSTTSGLQGFWIGGDFATYTDGAEAAIPGNDQILPLVAPRTEINIANPGTSTISVTIHLRELNGVEFAAPVTRIIPGLGVFQAMASAIFPNVDFTQPTHLRLDSAGLFVATSVVSGLLTPVDTGVVNGAHVSLAIPEMYFPHIVSGGPHYSTVLGITNLASTAQTVSITYTRPNGSSPRTVQRVVAGNGTLRETTESLFNFSELEIGWVKVTGTAPITGYIAYASVVTGAFALVPVQVTPRTSLLFAHIADVTPWSTGLALLNATNTAANVEVFAIYPDGGLVGGPETTPTASFTLNPGEKFSKLVGEEIVGKSVNGGFVFVRTTNNVPLYGLQSFFTRDVNFFANIAAGSLAPGITFTPPTMAVLATSLPRTTRGTTVTLTGSNFSPVAGNNIVTFVTATGTVDVAASTATATSLTVVVPSTAISGPVVVRVNGQSTALFVVEVTASPTSIDQNVVRLSAGQAATGIDIYVPRSTGAALNAFGVGAGDIGEISFSFAGSADLPRGQTRDLAVTGVGMSELNGSSISFSGEGLTATNVRFQSNSVTSTIIVTIAVDANAEIGPRNIGIKNSNLDQTIVSGGVFVR
jgi:hypothetical protein